MFINHNNLHLKSEENRLVTHHLIFDSLTAAVGSAEAAPYQRSTAIFVDSSDMKRTCCAHSSTEASLLSPLDATSNVKEKSQVQILDISFEIDEA